MSIFNANISENITKSINKFLTDQSLKILQTTAITTNQTVTVSQISNAHVTIGDIKDSVIHLDQNIDVDVKVLQALTNKEITNIETNFKKIIHEAIIAKNNETTGGWSFGNVNFGVNAATTETENFDDLSKKFTTTLTSNFNGMISAAQTDKRVVILGDLTNSVFTMDQNLGIKSAVITTLDSTAGIKLRDYFLESVDKTTVTSNDQIIKGVSMLDFILGILFIAAPVLIGPVIVTKVASGVIPNPLKKGASVAYRIVSFFVVAILLTLLIVGILKLFGKLNFSKKDKQE
jgi:hypothetical protein